MNYDFSIPKDSDVLIIKNKMIILQNEYHKHQNTVNQLHNMVSYVEYQIEVMEHEINVEIGKMDKTAENGIKLTKEERKSALFFSYEKNISLPIDIKKYPVDAKFEDQRINLSKLKYVYLLFSNKLMAARSVMAELISAINVCQMYPSKLY